MTLPMSVESVGTVNAEFDGTALSNWGFGHACALLKREIGGGAIGAGGASGGMSGGGGGMMSGLYSGQLCELCPANNPPANIGQSDRPLFRDLFMFSVLSRDEATLDISDFPTTRTKDVKRAMNGWKSRADDIEEDTIDPIMNRLTGDRDGFPKSWAEWKDMKSTAGGCCKNCWNQYCTDKGL
jgi:hypothetical protein